MRRLEAERLYDQILRSPLVSEDREMSISVNAYRPRHLRLLRAIEEHLTLSRGSILDVGCGNGLLLRLASLLEFKEYIGVDFLEPEPSKSFIGDLKRMRFLKKDFNEPDFLSGLGDESIDCVVSTEVFEHILNYPFGYLLECWRVLRKDGILLLTVPNPSTLANIMRLFKGQATLGGDVLFAKTPKVSAEKRLVGVIGHIHYREYTNKDMKQIVSSLEGAKLLETGFLSTDATPHDPLGKKVLKRLIPLAGLNHTRLFSLSQYFVLRKTG